MLHMLRGRLGTETFWAGIREYYRRHRDGNVSTDDFRRVMEEVSGQDLAGFFQQWLEAARLARGERYLALSGRGPQDRGRAQPSPGGRAVSIID